MTDRIPLIGHRGEMGRGLKIRLSDCDESVPPPHVTEKHRQLQERIDRRAVTDGEEHGWIEHDGQEVTDWDVDDDLL